ncbi:hypothetical protein [Mesorhizobium sp. BR1-1-14]|nr:hypothetical protein [Mesorhizobium sp. BR1-1-14]MBZ9960833.1 hypothetical protein [Mesorhizobium sp. BR1-1-14]
MTNPEKETDEKRFNETLKRMLKTPPKPHGVAKSDKKKPAKRRAKVN